MTASQSGSWNPLAVVIPSYYLSRDNGRLAGGVGPRFPGGEVRFQRVDWLLDVIADNENYVNDYLILWNWMVIPI